MLIKEAMQMLFKVNRVTQAKIARYLGTDQRVISRDLHNDRLTVGRTVELLDFLGYELIIREKITGRRAEDEIIIDKNPEFRDDSEIDDMDFEIDLEELEERLEEKEEEKEEPKKSSRELLEEKKGKGAKIGKMEAARILGISTPTMNKRYGELFSHNQIPVEKLIEILDNGSIKAINEKIKKKPVFVDVAVDEAVAEPLRRRIAEVCPGKMFLNKSDLAKIIGVSRQTIHTRFSKYFTNNTITVNEFISAFRVEGMELR